MESAKSFIQKLKYKIYTGEIKRLTSFKYSCFEYCFDLNQSSQELFIDFIEKQEVILPWDICMFFKSNKINYRLKYKYNTKLKFKTNMSLLTWYFMYRLDNVKLFFKCFVTSRTSSGVALSFVSLKTKTNYAFIINFNKKYFSFKIKNQDRKDRNYIGRSFLCFEVGKLQVKKVGEK